MLAEETERMLRSLALLLVLSSLCGSSRADTVDLAEWSRGGWSVTVDGVIGTFTLQVARQGLLGSAVTAPQARVKYIPVPEKH